jgi:hypothetical protein
MLNLPVKQKRTVYQTEIDIKDEYPHDDIYDNGYEAYHVDTDFSEILVNNTNNSRFVKNGKSDRAQATFLPKDEWKKLTQTWKE